MIFSCSSDSKLELVKPARLEVGDTIAFCAPSGSMMILFSETGDI